MFETGMAKSLTETSPILIDLLELVATQKSDQTVPPLIPLRKKAQGEEKKDRGNYYPLRKHQSSENLEAHPARWKSQSLNMGSMKTRVSAIFLSMKLSMASICFALLTSL